MTKRGKKYFELSTLNNILKVNTIILLLFSIVLYVLLDGTGLLLLMFPEFFITGYLLKLALVRCQFTGDVTKIKIAYLLFAIFVNGVKYILLCLTSNVYFAVSFSGILGSIIIFYYLNYINIVKFNDFFSEFNKKNYTRYLKEYKYWMPFLISTLSFLLYFNSDKIIIAWLLKPEDLAVYTIAATFISVGELVCTVVWSILLPRADFISKNTRYRIILRGIAILGGVGFFLIVLSFGRYLIDLFFSEQYPLAYSLSVCLSLYFIFRYSNIINELVIVNNGFQGKLAKYRLFCGFINVSFNLIFIPFFGVFTAAVTTVLSEFVLLAFLIYENRSKK
ncbi:polysaccharide biosynthesis C-terminal domain-containing protein [Photobacterium damselae subsp. damselae]|uniref:polysaccharide biosynthesis C-terminal domain-containing protein n=1 Tax=Photobacterium damselae TaxID=38293 RepID=UPI00311ADAEB